jgi:hypothetical protein
MRGYFWRIFERDGLSHKKSFGYQWFFTDISIGNIDQSKGFIIMASFRINPAAVSRKRLAISLVLTATQVAVLILEAKLEAKKQARANQLEALVERQLGEANERNAIGTYSAAFGEGIPGLANRSKKVVDTESSK